MMTHFKGTDGIFDMFRDPNKLHKFQKWPSAISLDLKSARPAFFWDALCAGKIRLNELLWVEK